MARPTTAYISFTLRDFKSTKPTPIIGIIRFSNEHLKVATGFSVLPMYWSVSDGRVMNKIVVKHRKEINKYLDELVEAADEIIPDLKFKRIQITKEILRERIKQFLVKKTQAPSSGEPALYKFIASFIDESPKRVNINNGKTVEKRTIQKYQTVFKVLKEFGATYKNRIDFDTIDLKFYDAFTSYLTNNQGFAINNIGKYIQTLKVFLNEASSKGISVNPDYRSRRFKVVKEDSDSIYFTEAELDQLYLLDLTDTKRLERIRDLFLVGCYTGLRFSDLTNLRPEFINNGVIRLEQFKTIDKVVIPCHPIVKAMLKKYNNELPCSISNQKMNDYLKELCEIAGFNSPITKAITKAGKRLVTVLKKWEMVSTHTARRSFATNMYSAGIPSFTIMKITGHKTEKAFMRYIKLDKEEHANIIAAIWQERYAGKYA